jgi:hypothetical protein
MRYNPNVTGPADRWSREDKLLLKKYCEQLQSLALNYELIDSDQENEMLELAIDIGTLVRKYVR